MRISVESSGTWSILRFSGQLVQGEPIESFTAAIQELIAQGRAHIVCDLGDVYTVDSTGTGVLVAARALVTNAGGRLVLYQPSKKVRAVLTTMHLMGIFDVADDEEALQTLRQQHEMGG